MDCACATPARKRLTTDGFAELFQVNFLGSFVLLNRLLADGTLPNATLAAAGAPRRDGAARPRVLITSSETHRQAPAILEHPDVLLFGWGHTLPMIADAMGVTLEKIDTVWEKWATPTEINHQHGVIPAGCCAAIRFEIRGWVRGEPRIVLEHCNRVRRAAAPDWPKGRGFEHDVYRVLIEGEPCIEQETALRDAATGDANRAGCLATGMRAVQAIPAVCAAPPGLISALDLPLIPGVGNLR